MGYWWNYLLVTFFSVGGKGKGTVPHNTGGIDGDAIRTNERIDTGSNQSGGLYTVSESDRLLDHNGTDNQRDTVVGNNPTAHSRVSIPRRISKWITHREATKSNTAIKFGIDNTPTEKQISVMRYAGEKFFDPLREHFGVPLWISSFYRSKALNTKVGGADESHHQVKGDICAIDIDMDGHGKPTNAELFYYIKNNCDFYMLIWEFGDNKTPDWVHISYSTDEAKNKAKHVYRATKQNNRTVYTRF